MSEPIDALKTALADRYRLERELGAGGMATVYLAQDLRHDRRVAIKVLRPELAAVIGADRFLAEIKTTANLQHPHILPLFDSGKVQVASAAQDSGLTTHVYYVMPFVEGESLRDRLVREHQLPVGDAVRIASEVASALDYAHRHGVIHRDIKPENILLHDGQALVADFGIALAVTSTASSRMTETGMSLGTPHYMSPEQAMGEREITGRADVYALGCVLYEMLTGEPPFSGPTAQAIIARVMTEEPRGLTMQRRSVPEHVEAAIFTALEKLPADRFATPAEFAAALGNPDGAATTRSGGYRRGEARSRRRRILLAPWLLAVAGLVAAAWGWLRPTADERVTWQALTLGDSLGLTPYGPALAVAPDGRSFVFRDGVQNGILWLKRWNQLDPIPLPGTERSTSPSFSSDGQWLAFTADGQVRKMRATGGSPATVVDSAAPINYGVTWLDDGSLIYANAIGDQLERLEPDGSTSVLNPEGSGLRGYGLLNPTPLPGSHGVLFLACTSGCISMSIYVVPLDGGPPKKLVDEAYQAWYLPIGQLLYVRRDGTAIAVPFDLDRLEITGAGVPVIDRVEVRANAPRLAVSRGGTLLYVPGRSEERGQEIVRVSPGGLITPVDTAWTGEFNSLALSTDGRQLAVGTALPTGGLAVYLKGLDHGPYSRLSFGGDDRRPAWSPDGRWVAYIRDSTNGGAVYGRRSDGSGSDSLLVTLNRPIQEVTWSGDGRWLVVRTDNGTAGAGDLIAVPMTGDTTRVPIAASPFTEMQPAVSPDGHWIAYVSNEVGTNEVFVRSFPDASAGRWQVSNGGGTSPVWSRDGRTLYYLDFDLRLTTASVQLSPAFVVTATRRLFDASRFEIEGFHQSFAVAPDGSGFYFRQTRGAPGQGTLAVRAVLAEHWFADLKARLTR